MRISEILSLRTTPEAPLIQLEPTQTLGTQALLLFFLIYILVGLVLCCYAGHSLVAASAAILFFFFFAVHGLLTVVVSLLAEYRFEAHEL